ncbi:MAG: mannitol dehydrogenase family protein, partial [Granulosicoccus sp.]|nr:mannitol dehydrogenase family protein [Granulosicoccus sp.]
MKRLVRGDLATTATGVVHLGLGAFFRAHGALYIQEAVERSGGQWGVCGVSLRSPDQRDRLAPQGFVYTAVCLSPDGRIPSCVHIVNDVLVARENPEAVLNIMTDPAVKLVTLTVTEKGYCHVPSSGELNQAHPDIVHDVANSGVPLSAPGFIVEALARRHASGDAPFTVLSCDNLPQNGEVARQVILTLARMRSEELADWIGSQGAFPSCMVDRIVPATTTEDIDSLSVQTGRFDASPVMHEPFRQWVIEDDFVQDSRPDLASVGVQLVSDVKPFELMKLRCLNGTHSALAYLGFLAGHETISEATADDVFARFIERMWEEEIVPSFAAPPNTDMSAYTRSLLERYRNPAIRHLTRQIAMDGSQKIPQRLLATISDNLCAGRSIHCLSLAVAGWVRYASGTDEQGVRIEISDPLVDQFRKISSRTLSATDTVVAFLQIAEIFPAQLANDPVFRGALIDA